MSPAALVVIQTLARISSISNHNLLALHTTGILSNLLPLAFEPDTPLGACERRSVEALCASLLSLGINNLNDAQYLVCNKYPAAAEFLLQAMKISHCPAYIQLIYLCRATLQLNSQH